MPDAPKPVTVGDLMVTERADLQANTWGYRRATLADLVSALRAEGVLVVEKVDGRWAKWAVARLFEVLDRYDVGPVTHLVLDALLTESEGLAVNEE